MSRSIVHIDLIESKGCKLSPDIRRERDNAIGDLLQRNIFHPLNDNNAPYHMVLSIKDRRLVIEMTNGQKELLPKITLSLRPYKNIIKDYFMMVESYNEARYMGGDKLQAIDMGRRGIHNEGAECLKEQLASKIEVDVETARRLFTLICILHIGQVRGPRI